MSAISMLGVPKEIYQFGSQFGMLAVSFPLVMYSVTYWFLPVFWNLGVSTSYEVSFFRAIDCYLGYFIFNRKCQISHSISNLFSIQYLEWRFDRNVRLLCSFLFLIQTVLYMAIVVYAPSLAIAQGTLIYYLNYEMQRAIS